MSSAIRLQRHLGWGVLRPRHPSHVLLLSVSGPLAPGQGRPNLTKTSSGRFCGVRWYPLTPHSILKQEPSWSQAP